MDRRVLLQGGLAAGLIGVPSLARAQSLNLIPIRVDVPAVFRTTVCLRPFRAVGPRIEAEALGRKTVVHNYGHGGSGWSLSWGSGAEAVGLAMQVAQKTAPRRIAVIGAGALGLTAAITAQHAGADVTIYARERFPYVRSARATGLWTPDSRIAKTDAVAADFGDRWERMARTALTMHESFVSLPGNPVEWIDNYQCRNPRPPLPEGAPPPPPEEDPGFIELRDRLSDVQPHSVEIPAGTHPFNAATVRRNAMLSFNVADYSHQLESDFLAAGGRFEVAEFKTPSDLLRLKESVLINCTGYGARALFRDDSIVPVRGQIVWLAPQEGVHYAIGYGSLGVIARRDGIVVQEYGPNDNFGFGDDNETADPVAAAAAVERLKQIYA
jgi:glycine/D-amino acid oxidase-like deaminating enzyme